ncbi:hypothetical protein HOP50_01g05730 [Chloropicon primus]|uniref:MARVEL domain-containing protein n=1 Tax=Chloropicon primus TaxID=1764295 RepID=A0A5B8MCH2_9CHLO|nr:hypothetical protein A3770_01p05870 [Chloropicon primus]UPQ97282.1 hypothetical protein HOP50_01g05730 [Chloropicon primus]|mmetsp:Transcript_5878/g.17702  ORF Transcript_5878/g.17702 Transcript_5878/m.17702 type:complete len:210 (-) Transcript_5878:106-735(-)|eukprot:QDZ18069.1 hypothetical protein A3770_01p05870 [Chloropicon primus]
MMQGETGADPLPPSAGPSVTDRAKEQMQNIGTQVTTQVQGAFTHPYLPVVFRGWIFLFSLLSWTITASTVSVGEVDPVNFQLASGLIVWLFSIFWLVVEVSLIMDKSLIFPTGSKVLNRIEIYSDCAVAFLAFGAACSVAGLTSTTCTNSFFTKIANAECDKLLASNVFMWFTWLVQVIPLLIFTGPAIASATEAEEGTVLRSALKTRK